MFTNRYTELPIVIYNTTHFFLIQIYCNNHGAKKQAVVYNQLILVASDAVYIVMTIK